jgi:hypothetical protein
MNTSIAALPESFGSLSNLGSLCVRPDPRTWAWHLRVRFTWGRRHAIGRACATSRVRPCRIIANTPIAALPESFARLSKLEYLCVRRGTLRAWLRHLRARCTYESAGAVAGCGAARDRMRVCDAMVQLCRRVAKTPIGALPESFTSLSKLSYLCVRRKPARLGVALARPVHFGVGRAVAGMRCGARPDARVRRRG